MVLQLLKLLLPPTGIYHSETITVEDTMQKRLVWCCSWSFSKRAFSYPREGCRYAWWRSTQQVFDAHLMGSCWPWNWSVRLKKHPAKKVNAEAGLKKKLQTCLSPFEGERKITYTCKNVQMDIHDVTKRVLAKSSGRQEIAKPSFNQWRSDCDCARLGLRLILLNWQKLCKKLSFVTNIVSHKPPSHHGS